MRGAALSRQTSRSTPPLAPSSQRLRFQRLSPEVLEAVAFYSGNPRVTEQVLQAINDAVDVIDHQASGAH